MALTRRPLVLSVPGALAGCAVARAGGLAGVLGGHRVPVGDEHRPAAAELDEGVDLHGRPLGHASATVTLDRYSHLFADDLDAVADRL